MGFDLNWEVYGTGFVTADNLQLSSYDAVFPRALAAATPRDRGSETVKRVTGMFHTASPQLNTWAYAKQVIDAAAIKFGPSPAQWFAMQYVKNDRIHDTNLTFMNDTVAFILTGSRAIQLETWKGLIVKNPPRIAGAASVQRGVDYAAALKKRFNGWPNAAMFYRSWLGYPNGLVDMVQTLDILFGDTPFPVQQGAVRNSQIRS